MSSSRRKPLPSELSSMPKYPPSKELDAKIRNKEARRSHPPLDLGVKRDDLGVGLERTLINILSWLLATRRSGRLAMWDANLSLIALSTIKRTILTRHDDRRGYDVVMTTSLSSDVPVGYFSWAEYV
ncbi:hypothetical protein K2173_008929 [Erythroxylum novogranatense]|uniref:Uncharacterized protein n=1 Tax=Erythroxylum novogranatense TaxID=1862640 RepID=A0AAV8TSG4_9ROSI|nr:hypothetical protein K2173_008929 [Erythroxylum novogranatense]